MLFSKCSGRTVNATKSIYSKRMLFSKCMHAIIIMQFSSAYYHAILQVHVIIIMLFSKCMLLSSCYSPSESFLCACHTCLENSRACMCVVISCHANSCLVVVKGVWLVICGRTIIIATKFWTINLLKQTMTLNGHLYMQCMAEHLHMAFHILAKCPWGGTKEILLRSGCMWRPYGRSASPILWPCYSTPLTEYKTTYSLNQHYAV